MATVRPEREDKTAQAAADTANATNVPQLRDAVTILIEAVQRLEAKVARLERRIARTGRG